LTQEWLLHKELIQVRAGLKDWTPPTEFQDGKAYEMLIDLSNDGNGISATDLCAKGVLCQVLMDVSRNRWPYAIQSVRV